MKKLQQFCLSALIIVGLAGFGVVTQRASAADVIIHLGGEVVAPGPAPVVVAPAPAPAPVVYNYVYYPDEEVYFVPDTRVYWWRDRGEWRSGPRIPDGFHLGTSVNLRVDGRDPWRHHEVVVQHYPRHDRDHDHDRH